MNQGFSPDFVLIKRIFLFPYGEGKLHLSGLLPALAEALPADFLKGGSYQVWRRLRFPVAYDRDQSQACEAIVLTGSLPARLELSYVQQSR